MADGHDVELVKLQMAMAFGQGAGSMLAAEEAIGQMFASNSDIVDRAIQDWDQSRWAFIELMRVLGQMAAVRAAMAGQGYIRWMDIEGALPAALGLCPCAHKDGYRNRYPIR